MDDKNNYISLKEAAKISGYTSDYVGQLIRKGKISGKQVFSNVAWVTTEKAIKQYLNKDKEKNNTKTNQYQNFKKKNIFKGNLSAIRYSALLLTIGILIIFILFLFYALAVNFDKSIEQRSLERIQHAIQE